MTSACTTHTKKVSTCTHRSRLDACLLFLLDLTFVPLHFLIAEYRDDSFVIPRSTSVVARRLPPARPGKGTAAIYVAGVNDGSRAAAAAKGAGQKSAGFGGQRAGGFNTGAHMQKRFDAKDEVSRWIHMQRQSTCRGCEGGIEGAS